MDAVVFGTNTQTAVCMVASLIASLDILYITVAARASIVHMNLWCFVYDLWTKVERFGTGIHFKRKI